MKPPTPLSSPVLIIGDVHGNVPFLERLQELYPDHRKIFVGDFVDSRQYTRADELKSLDIVIEMIGRGEGRALLGNHEWSYLDPTMRCTGYDEAFEERLHPYKEKLLTLFEYFVWFPDFHLLVTHAGLTFQLWQEVGLNLRNLEMVLTQWARQPAADTPAGRIGLARGGVDPVGGIFWCDWYSEFQPVPRLTQVFGHTSALSVQEELQGKPIGIRRRGSNYNIDCLTRTWEVLELGTNGELRTVTLDQPGTDRHGMDQTRPDNNDRRTPPAPSEEDPGRP